MRSKTVLGFPNHGCTTERVQAEKHHCPEAGPPWVILWMRRWDRVGKQLVVDDGISLRPRKAIELGKALVQMGEELLAEHG